MQDITEQGIIEFITILSHKKEQILKKLDLSHTLKVSSSKSSSSSSSSANSTTANTIESSKDVVISKCIDLGLSHLNVIL